MFLSFMQRPSYSGKRKKEKKDMYEVTMWLHEGDSTFRRVDWPMCGVGPPPFSLMAYLEV